MSDAVQFRSARQLGRLLLAATAVMVMPLATTIESAAQINGIPPSVTSIQYHFPPYLPNARPSVTSLGPLGYVGPPAFPPYPSNPWPYLGAFPRRHSSGFGFKNRSGFGSVFVAPVFVPIDDSWNADDPGGAGPYVYSGPPPDQMPHIVVDTPPVRRDVVADSEDEERLPAPPVAKSRDDAQPIDATVLVFRDGHHQEVTNYAIMGQTVYIFDTPRQKIALRDLDVPATIKTNDDRGVEFQLPDPKQS